jgi:hypothetical protein
MAVAPVDFDYVKERLSLSSDEEVVNAIESAINATAVFFESYLSTPFKKSTYKDYFQVNKTYFWLETVNNRIRLRLHAAFLLATPAPVLKCADSLVDITTDTGVEDIPAKDYSLDLGRGVVYLEESYDKKYVSVAYTAGFTGSGDSSIPEWLKEACVAFLPSILAQQPNVSQKIESLNLAKVSQQMAIMIVGDHSRLSVPFTLNRLL